mmetsp:Transcript_10609/g.32455  ORF Transcript_10609/g.32455 Transcript_10609/m.32455 type:complete len:233 (+) Transcript_10609:1514-2212(+)
MVASSNEGKKLNKTTRKIPFTERVPLSTIRTSAPVRDAEWKSASREWMCSNACLVTLRPMAYWARENTTFRSSCVTVDISFKNPWRRTRIEHTLAPTATFPPPVFPMFGRTFSSCGGTAPVVTASTAALKKYGTAKFNTFDDSIRSMAITSLVIILFSCREIFAKNLNTSVAEVPLIETRLSSGLKPADDAFTIRTRRPCATEHRLDRRDLTEQLCSDGLPTFTCEHVFTNA